jgi:hypothetical protein
MTSISDRDAARRLLNALYELAVEDGLFFHLCSRSNFTGEWFNDISEGLDWAMKRCSRECVWVNVGLRNEPPAGDHERGSMKDCAGITSMWADIDVSHDVHAKSDKLPPDYESALALVNGSFGSVKPSAIIDSGHGLQAWWFLDEPWIFDSDEDRQRAYQLSQRFSATLKLSAMEKGWTVDSVFDLVRVLRLPGTANRKVKGDPKPVKILQIDEGRSWSIDDIEGVVVAQEFMPASYGGPQAVESVSRLVLERGAQPSLELFSALSANVDEFRASWENKRPDFADQSPSSYDMSLATYAAQAGWSDQDIANLLIAHREKRGHDLKTTRRGDLRQDYYQRTIARAREGIGSQATTSNLNKGVSVAPTAAGAAVSDVERARILKDASYVFGVPISRFVQYGEGEDASYILELATGESVTIGSAQSLQSPKTWATKLFPISRKLFEPLKAKGWVTLINSLGLIVDIEENPESSRMEQVIDLLSAYLQSTMMTREEERDIAVKGSQPFVQDGRLWISRVGFESWVKAGQVQKVVVDDVWAALRAMKFTSSAISASVSGRRYSRRYWSSPIDQCGEYLGLQVSKSTTPAGADT